MCKFYSSFTFKSTLVFFSSMGLIFLLGSSNSKAMEGIEEVGRFPSRIYLKDEIINLYNKDPLRFQEIFPFVRQTRNFSIENFANLGETQGAYLQNAYQVAVPPIFSPTSSFLLENSFPLKAPLKPKKYSSSEERDFGECEEFSQKILQLLPEQYKTLLTEVLGLYLSAVKTGKQSRSWDLQLSIFSALITYVNPEGQRIVEFSPKRGAQKEDITTYLTKFRDVLNKHFGPNPILGSTLETPLVKAAKASLNSALKNAKAALKSLPAATKSSDPQWLVLPPSKEKIVSLQHISPSPFLLRIDASPTIPIIALMTNPPPPITITSPPIISSPFYLPGENIPLGNQQEKQDLPPIETPLLLSNKDTPPSNDPLDSWDLDPDPLRGVAASAPPPLKKLKTEAERNISSLEEKPALPSKTKDKRNEAVLILDDSEEEIRVAQKIKTEREKQIVVICDDSDKESGLPPERREKPEDIQKRIERLQKENERLRQQLEVSSSRKWGQF